MPERNYEISPPFDEALNARLNAGVPVTVTPGQLAAIKAIHAEHENVAVKITGPGVHDLQVLPEDSMEARLMGEEVSEVAYGGSRPPSTSSALAESLRDLQILREDSMEARLEEARGGERERCAHIAATFDAFTKAGEDTSDFMKGFTTGNRNAASRISSAIRGGTNGEEGDRSAGAETEGNVSPE